MEESVTFFMKAYCPDCGSATEYSLSKPKFCASCGKSFSLTASAPVKKIFKPRARTVEPQIEIEEEEEIVETPNDGKIEISCPDCSQSLRIPSSYEGSVRCPSCKTIFKSTDSEV